MNPHDYALFIREYPKWFDMDGIETVFVTDFILSKMKEKGVTPPRSPSRAGSPTTTPAR